MKLTEHKIPDIAELSRWKLSLAVAFSAITGYMLFAGEEPRGVVIAAGAGVFLLSAGASALNQFTERRSDALMGRTAGRPLPSGRMAPPAAMVTAVILLAAGIVVLARGGTWPVLLGALNVILYNLIYTGLKKKTTLAIIPGALVGAVPPLIGYTAAGGAMTDTRILLFALFMFLWQMPHFWLLLVRYGEEYEKAGIKTLHRRMDKTSIMRLVMAWITGSSFLLWILTAIFMPFSSTASLILLLLNGAFIIAFAGIIREKSDSTRSKYAFVAFNSFTALVMAILIAFA
ncbi:MAG: protoheme IX farnesyltransferase [Bacteroidota bacterium]|nr:protoheme IX farnesyltransferase [Bacteroidota bacterium]